MLRLEPLPMEEARQFWADKVQMGPGEFAKLVAEARVKAFAVAGIAKGDELDTVYRAMQQAIEQGTTLEDFKKECAAIFERRGWTGKRAWRMDNIFRTNIQTAYNVGQYRQLRDASGVFSHWQYSAINDARTRPTHLAMDGRVWAKDHPVWHTWFPPNGYRCRCSVIGLTREQVVGRGLTVEEDDPTNGLIEPIDPGTGNRMPARQLLPDPGFGFNPGVAYWEGIGEVVAQRMESWTPAVRGPALREILSGPVFAHWHAHPQGRFPVGRIDDALAGQLGARSPVVRLPAETVAALSSAAADFALVQEALTRGRRVPGAPGSTAYIYKDGSRSIEVRLELVDGVLTVARFGVRDL